MMQGKLDELKKQILETQRARTMMFKYQGELLNKIDVGHMKNVLDLKNTLEIYQKVKNYE